MTIRLLTLAISDAEGRKLFMEAFARALATPHTPARTGYWLSKIYTACSSEVREFDDVRNRRIRELGVPVDGQPDQVRVPDDKMPELIAELYSMDRDIDIPVPDGAKLALPPDFTPADWQPILAAFDIFEEPN